MAASTVLNRAVAAPIPIASVALAVIRNERWCSSVLAALANVESIPHLLSSTGSDRGQTRVRPGSDRGQTGVRPGSDQGQTPRACESRRYYTPPGISRACSNANRQNTGHQMTSLKTQIQPKFQGSA